MLDVYICEDNPKELDYIRNGIDNIILFEQLDIQLAAASTNPHDILSAAQKATNTGLYFLDVDLQCDDMNGFVLAQHLRKIEPRCFIVFITSHMELSFYTYQYKLEALDYIIKDDIEHVKTRVHECILNAYEKHNSGFKSYRETFAVTLPDGRLISVANQDIYYFETSVDSPRIVLHALNRRCEFSERLNDIEKRCSYEFFRCHRSFIVNLRNISEINYNRNEIIMKNGSRIPISVRRKNELKKRMNSL